MKRELFQNVLALPYKSGEAIVREGYLSAVVGAVVGTGGKLTVTIEHSDDGETFVPVTDPLVFPEKKTEGGKFVFEEPVGAEDAEGSLDTAGVVNIDVDLVGLMNFIKFTVEGSTSLVVVLGDSTVQPV